MVCVLNKIDAISIVGLAHGRVLTMQEELDLLYKIPNSVPISSKLWLNVDDELKEEMWRKLECVSPMLIALTTQPRSCLHQAERKAARLHAAGRSAPQPLQG